MPYIECHPQQRYTWLIQRDLKTYALQTDFVVTISTEKRSYQCFKSQLHKNALLFISDYFVLFGIFLGHIIICKLSSK